MSNSTIQAVLAVGARRSKDAIIDNLPRAAIQGTKWIAANPGTAAACGAVSVGFVLVAAPGAIVAPALAAAGFGTQGVVAGSAAAGFQSSIGSVVAPSVFATLQSAGAGGYGAAAVYGTAQAAGGLLMSAASGGFAWAKTKL